MSGYLEETNEPYAIAKIAGIKLVQAYRSQYNRDWIPIMPTNLYGPFDNFDPVKSHVLPALMAGIHEAKVKNLDKVVIWGDGTPLREFMHVDDLANACIDGLVEYSDLSPINIGTGTEISIRKLAKEISNVVGFGGQLIFDIEKQNGAPRKFLDSGKISSLGWPPQILLKDGLVSTYDWYLESIKEGVSKI